METSSQGLTTNEAQERLRRFRSQFMKSKGKSNTLTLLLAQFKSPIILILLFAAGLSFFLHDATDALIILVIIFISALLGFWQERGASHAMEKLLAIVKTKVTVLRDQSKVDVPVEEIVPGDVVLLSAGASIPGDCCILESKTLFVDEAALTGETYPVEKAAGLVSEETPPCRRTNTLFLGTHVVSGSAKAVIVLIGHETEFGKISEKFKLRPPKTEFERCIRRFGYLILEVTLILVIAIFAINVYLAHPVLEAFLFSLALAVGLTPQLLPAIISVNLAHGARTMANIRSL